MSYLVDALKKAERERYARRTQEMHALSPGDGALSGNPRAGPWLWLVAILVAINVALAVYVWRARPADFGPTLTTPGAWSLPNAGQRAPLVPFSALPSDSQDAAPTRPVQSMPPTTALSQRTAAVRATLTSAGRRPRAPPDTGKLSRPEPADRPQRYGRVTHSNERVGGHGASDARGTGRPGDDDDDSHAPHRSEINGVPSVHINGQLYSTVRGRSFILVNGRRYHEGERLVEGPTVESIGRTGAMLSYHGQRYHVAGPD